MDGGELLSRAEGEGVSFVNGADFYTDGSGGRGSARLAFSSVSPEEIAEGVARLSALLTKPAVPA